MRSSKWRCDPCRKTAYASERRGWAAIETILSLPHRTETVPSRVYQCPFGNGYHLTHQRERSSV